jgi:hypothetical protein
VSVSVVLPLVVMLVGLKLAVRPAMLLAVKVTAELKPFCGATVRVIVPVLPATRASEVVELVSVKLGAGVTVTEMVDVCLSDPLVAVTTRE